MKKLLFLTLLIPILIHAQTAKPNNSFQLRGSIDGLKKFTAILTYIDLNNNRKSDTINSKSGSFMFSGNDFDPSWVFLKFISEKKEYSTGFMLENGYQTIKTNKEGKIYNIKGNKLHMDYMKLSSNSSDQTKEIEYIKKNTKSPLTTLLLSSLLYQKKITTIQALQLYNNLSSNIKLSQRGKHVQREINIRTVPRIAPDFLINDSLKLSGLRGKLVLLDFWASWCIPCREETPKLKQLFQKYKNELKIITISLDENREKWREAIKHDDMHEWTNILRDDAIKKEYFNGAELSIPMLILIDRNGDIIWNTINGTDRDELELAIKKVIPI